MHLHVSDPIPGGRLYMQEQGEDFKGQYANGRSWSAIEYAGRLPCLGS